MWLVAVAIMAQGVWLARGHLLDDAFIHLRYAENLSLGLGLTFNGDRPSFGTSSPAYTIFLAFVGRIVSRSSWPLMAKTVSVVCHGTGLVLLWLICRRSHRLRTLFPVLVALMWASPSSIRWLQDGMETSAAVLLSILAALAVRQSTGQRLNPVMAKCTGLLAALPGVLRFDGLAISGAAIAACLLSLRRHPRDAWTQLAQWIVVTVLAFAVTTVATGHLTPDSALAKAGGAAVVPWFVGLARAMAAVSPLWPVALPLLMVRGLAVRSESWLALLGTAPILSHVMAGAVRGQAIHGARYFLPALAFAWTIWLCLEADGDDADRAHRSSTMAILGAASVLSALHLASFYGMRRVLTPPTVEFTPELAQSGTRVMVHDLGRLSWQFPLTAMDLAGLVCGREIAELPAKARPCGLVRMYGLPEVLVLIDDQARELDPQADHGKITLTCGAQVAQYRRHHMVMTASNLTKKLVWHLWKPAPE